MVENADYGLRTRTADSDCRLGLRTRIADSVDTLSDPSYMYHYSLYAHIYLHIHRYP